MSYRSKRGFRDHRVVPLSQNSVGIDRVSDYEHGE